MNPLARERVSTLSSLASALLLVVASNATAQTVRQKVEAPPTQKKQVEVEVEEEGRGRLENLFNQAYASKQWKKAIEIGLELVGREKSEARVVLEYNLACVFALAEQRDEAIHWLRRSAADGFSNLQLFEHDSDLRPLRGDPAYREIVEVVRKNYFAYRERIREKADKSEPVVLVPDNLAKDRPAPVVVVLHPYGGTPEGIAECFREATFEMGAILVAPRALHPVGGGYEWGAEEDVSMLVDRALDRLEKERPIDRARIVLGGFSQGATRSLDLGMHHPERFCGIVSVGGEFMSLAVDPESDLRKLPRFYLMVGANDRRASCNELARRELECAGITVKLEVFPGLGHDFPRDRVRELATALRFVLSR